MRLRLPVVLTALVVAVAVSAIVATGAFAHRSAAPIKVKVGMTEFKFKLSRTSVPRGSTVIFTVVNNGNTAHDFDFKTLGHKTPYLQPGESKTLKMTFKKKGRFTYDCTVPRHAEQGMEGLFIVK